MLLTKLKGSTKYNISLNKYLIDWDRKVSAPQFKIKSLLKPYWLSDMVFEECYIPGSKLRLDLFNYTKKLIVEISPDKVHLKFNKFFHKDRQNFLQRLEKDRQKTEWAQKNDLTIVHLYDTDIANFDAKKFHDEILNGVE